MKRVLLAFSGMLLSFGIVMAQEEDRFHFEDYSAAYDVSQVNSETLQKHYLGYEIAQKIFLLNQTYTRIEPPTDVNPVEKTIVDKPTIYYSVKKLNNYFKKQIKSGSIQAEEAKEKLNAYLDICLSIYSQDTKLFEEALKNSKSDDQIDMLFSSVVID